MEKLPIFESRDEILDSVGAGLRVLLSAPTGSGKSTQVPQFLADQCIERDKIVYVTQPRRVANQSFGPASGK